MILFFYTVKWAIAWLFIIRSSRSVINSTFCGSQDLWQTSKLPNQNFDLYIIYINTCTSAIDSVPMKIRRSFCACENQGSGDAQHMSARALTRALAHFIMPEGLLSATRGDSADQQLVDEQLLNEDVWINSRYRIYPQDFRLPLGRGILLLINHSPGAVQNDPFRCVSQFPANATFSSL